MKKGFHLVEDGKHVILFHPPGWLAIGTVVDHSGTSLQDSCMVLKDCAWIENEHPNCSAFDLCEATTAKQQKAIISASWRLPDGTAFYGPTLIAELPRDVKPLCREKDAKAIKEAAGG